MRKKLRKVQAQLAKEQEEVVDLDIEELESIVEKSKTVLDDKEMHKLRSAIEALNTVGWELDQKKASIQRLKQMLFGETTEKTENVFKGKVRPKDNKSKEPAKGHGRNGAKDYAGAKKTEVKHPELKA